MTLAGTQVRCVRAYEEGVNATKAKHYVILAIEPLWGSRFICVLATRHICVFSYVPTVLCVQFL